MQEKTLPNQANSTSNIHSSEFGSVSYDIFGSPYQKTGSFLADDSLDFGYLGKPYNADTELYDYGFRDYSPEIARFTSVDPIRDGRNWYSYVVNDPVNYVDLWGLECKSESDANKYGETMFALKHPIVAIQLGLPKDGGKYGINSAATNFAINSKLPTSEFDGLKGFDEGSKKGSYRHAVWQAIICSKFDENIATQVGNSHDPITPDAQVSYSSLSDADTYCDQMNNELGRNLGKESNLSNKDLALKVLDYFHESGLYTVSQSTDGSYSVNLTKISDEEYETAYSEISKRNNQGLLK